MISLLYGENDFELKKYLRKITDDFADKNAIEKIDGDSMVADNLADLLAGMSLFSPERLIVLYDVSQNKEVWEKLSDYIETDTQLVLVESNPDKRTKTFKRLQKHADTHEFKNLTELEAKNWVVSEAKNRKIELVPSLAEKVVVRAGVDQWKLHFALQKLASSNEINEQTIVEQIEPTTHSSVFELIDASLHRSPEKVHQLVRELGVSEDPYFFFGLLSSQIFQLVTLAVSNHKPAEVAADLGVHPYPIQKLSNVARQLSRSDIQKIAAIIAECDDQIKRSGAEPWLLIEQALVKLAHR